MRPRPTRGRALTTASGLAAAAAGWWQAPPRDPVAAAARVLARLHLLHEAAEAEPPRPPPAAAAAIGLARTPGHGEPSPQAAAADPDRELLGRVLEEYPHETRWFSALVQRHWGRVWSVCRAVLLDADDAEDAAQTAFLRVHRYLPGYRRESAFRTWLTRIARNAALDLLASRQREREARGRLESDPSLQRPWLPAPARDPAHRSLDLRRALTRLDERDRLVLVLHEVEGVPYDEIAELLELSGGAVRMAAMRARRRLREVLERTEDRGT